MLGFRDLFYNPLGISNGPSCGEYEYFLKPHNMHYYSWAKRILFGTIVITSTLTPKK